MRLRRAGLCAILAVFTATAQERPIDTQRSAIEVHVGKAGLFSAAAHNHTIDAPISSGSIRETAPQSVAFTVQTAKMTVRSDPKVDSGTQATIQKDMDEMTLETGKFPEIRFQSTHAEKLANGQWKVDGDLSLHGVTKPVSLTVKPESGAYTTHIVLRQTDFGIKPISMGGGVIRVKDEVEIDCKIVPGPAPGRAQR